MYFEGDPGGRYRVIRAVKNRFGAVNEISVFAMSEKAKGDEKVSVEVRQASLEPSERLSHHSDTPRSAARTEDFRSVSPRPVARGVVEHSEQVKMYVM